MSSPLLLSLLCLLHLPGLWQDSAITASTAAAAGGDGSGSVLEIEADSAVILSEHPNLTVNPKQSK
jgi:hypothetical protein